MIEPTDKKVHFKMYKKGRFWVFAGIAAFTWQINTLNVHADTTDASTSTPSAEINTAATVDTTSHTAVLSSKTSMAQNKTATVDSTKTSDTQSTTASSDATKDTVAETETATDASSKQDTTTESATKTVTDTATDNSDSEDSTTTDTKTSADKSETNTNTGTDAIASDATTNDKVTDPTTDSSSQESNTETNETNETDTDTSNQTDADDSLTTTPDQNTTVPEENSTVTNDSDTLTTTPETITDNAEEKAPVTVKKAKTATLTAKTASVKAVAVKDIGSGTFGDSAWRIDSAGVLHINGGNFADTGGNNPWAKYATQITSIVFEGQVNASADSSFLFTDLKNLVTVTNGNNFNTSKVTNMASMFANNSSLTSIDVSQWDTSNVTSMHSMFLSASSLPTLDVSKWSTGKVTTMYCLFGGMSAIKSLDLNNWDVSRVTTMKLMFFNDVALTSVSLSNWNTSKVKIMRSMFSGATALETLDTSNWNTTNVNDMSYMFSGMTALKTVDISNWNTANVTDMSFMFANNPSLTTLNVSNLNTSKVTNMNNMFANDKQIAALDVSGWNTSKVTNMGYLFYNTKVKDLDVSNWDTSNVTTMVDLFAGNTTLQSLDVGKWDISKVTSIGAMFFGTQSLKTLDVSNWNTGNVTNMRSVFVGTNSLTTLDVSNWDTSNVTDMYQMFDGAISLVTIDVSNWNTSKVTNMSYMFWGNNKLTTLDVSNWNTSNVTDMSFMFTSNWVLSALDVSNWDTSKVTTMENMFAYDEALTTLNTSNWKTSNVTNMSNMFVGDINLTSVDVSGWDTSNVTTMAYMFWGNNKLVSLDVSKWSTGNVTDMSFMFTSNWVLGALDVSNWDTSKVTTMENMFAYDEALTTLNTSNWKTGNVTNMSKMFAGDLNLASVDVSGWDTSNVTTMYQMFWKNNSLIMLDVSGWDTSKVTDMTQMFWANGSLTTLDVSGWDTSNVENMYDMFDGDASLTVLDVSKWNTGKVTDMRFMFWGTSGLKVLDFSNWDMSNVGSTTSMLASTNLQKIILGAKNKWSSDTGLPDLTADATYSGNWISNDTKTYNSSDLLTNNVTGTYIRELATSGTTVDANDSALVAGPDTTWDAESNFAGAKDYYGKDLTFTDVTVSGDTVNTKVPGTYQVTYSYTDVTGNTIYKTITVTVTASTAAVETTDKTVEIGDNWDAADNFTGVDADGSSIDFSHVTVSGDTVNTKVPGTYNVTYSFKDSAGNTIYKTIQVVVYGIILNDTNKEISTTSDWTPAGNVNKATNVNGDELTGSDLIITITDKNGQVVTSLGKPGTYTVTYTFFSRSRSAETYSVSATITVTNKASLDVSGSTVKPGDAWSAEDNFKSATDENGDTIDFSKVTVSGSVDTTKPGSYDVTYTYTDAVGNPTTKTITVTVSASEASLDASDSSVKVGDTWSPEDNFNSAVDANGTTTIDFSKVTVSGDTVNTKVPGTYNVTYSFIDATGAKVSKTVKVVVYGITLTETEKELSTTANWDPTANIKQAVNVDGTAADVTVTIKDADGKVVTSLGKPGTYTVTYAIDGYTTTATITVTNKASLDVSGSTIKPGNTWNAEDNFNGATDENGDAIGFSKVTVSGSVDTNKPGDYKVTYTYTDAAGNPTWTTITVTVSASEANLDASNSSVKVGDTWNPEDNFNSAVDANGTTAIDFSKVTVSGDTVNTKVPGIYNVTYSFDDVTGATVSKTVKVIVYGITLTETEKNLSTTANWDPKTNIKQAVNVDGTAANVTVTMKGADGNVVTSLDKPGTYTVTYTIDGYATSATITVTNKASLDVSDSTVKPGDTWSAEDNFNGATDENGDAIDFSKVTVSGSVDTTKPGSYEVTYTYTDDAGNPTTKTITVTVSASEASLDASNSSVQVDDNWNPEDNFNSAVDANGTTTIDFSKVTVSGDNVNTKVPGTYKVTYSFVDATGATVSKTVKVVVYGIILNETDKTLSTTANWDPTTNIKQAVNIDGTDADVTVTMKDADGNIVKTLGTPGTYTVTYTIDGYTTTATITVTSKASLNVNDSTVKPGSTWDAANNFTSATDENGDAIDFSKVTVSGSVDTTKPGSYEVTYTYTDDAGNPTSKTITVKVSASEAGLDASDSSVKVGDSWNAKDNFNNAVNADGTTNVDFKDVTVSGDIVDTKVPGTYNVTYSFTDATGAIISKTVKVIVYGITLNETDKTLSTTNNWDPTTNIKQAINADGTTADVKVTMKDANGTTVTSLNKPGTYTVTYAIDGYTTTATVTVTSQASLDVQGSTLKPGAVWNAKDNFIGGTDENGNALDFSQITVTGSVNTNKPGSYKVTYTYTDAAGNETSQTITITVSDTNASIDAADSAIKVGSTWNAKDNFNSAVNADGTTNVDFNDVTVSGDTVNTKIPGTYHVTYRFTDSTGAIITKTVKVVVYGITLNEADKTLSTTSNWDPMSNIKQAVNADGTDAKVTVTMTDADGKTVTNLTKPGVYTITYTSTDDSVIATVTITNGATLNVVDSTVKPGSTWNAKDNFKGGTDENGDVLDFSQITVTGSVNTNKPGSYKVTYTYTDAAGNETSQTITITVSDTDANIDANDSTLKLGDTWNAEDNFNAAVNADGTTNVAFKDVTVSGDTVNTNVPGTYNVTYTFKDSTGATISKTVKVVVYGITLNETNKEISTTSNWDPTTNVKKATNGAGDELGGSDLAITIADENGKMVTALTKPGTYTVTYSFMTRAGESFTTSATIVVTNKASLNVNDSNLTAGDSWKPADNFVSGTDENGDTLDFSQITVTGSVDTNTAGTYKVSYSYTDANGDSITKVITVTVTAKDTDGNGDNGNGNGGTDTDGNGGGDTDTGDNNNGGGDTDTGNNNNNGGGNTDTGDTNNNGNGTDTDDSSDGDAINNGNNSQNDTTQSEGDTVAVKPVGTEPAKSAKKVSLKTAAKQVNGQAASDLDQLPQTNEQSTNRAASAGVVLLALGGLVLGLGKAVLNRRHN